MTDKLTKRVTEMKESFFNQFGKVPNMLLIPRHAGWLKNFASELNEATSGKAGSAPFIFHRLYVENAECSFLGMEIFVTDEVDDMEPDINMDPEDMAPQVQPGKIIH